MERVLEIWLICEGDLNGWEYMELLTRFGDVSEAQRQFRLFCEGGSLPEQEQLKSYFQKLRPKFKTALGEIPSESKLDEFRQSYEKNHLRVVLISEEDYPESLREIKDPPAVLFIYGVWPLEKIANTFVGVVGSRNCSEYGVRAAEALSMELEKKGVGIISGMARGIDSAAHRGALSEGGRTIAVIGSGHMRLYPREGKGLVERIGRYGAVLSEFPPYHEAQAYDFPRRNRIISGLSHGILVVEASMKSGSLITVDYALAQGKDVFAVPGNINSPSSKGTNFLIKQGAKIVLNPDDILEEYGLVSEDLRFGGECMLQRSKVDEEELKKLSPVANSICKLLVTKPMGQDQICQRLGIDSGIGLNGLVELELQGFIYFKHGYYHVNSF